MNLIVFPIRYNSLMSYQYRTLNILFNSRLRLTIGRTEILFNFILLLIENGTAQASGIYLFEKLFFEVSSGGMGTIVLIYQYIRDLTNFC